MPRSIRPKQYQQSDESGKEPERRVGTVVTSEQAGEHGNPFSSHLLMRPLQGKTERRRPLNRKNRRRRREMPITAENWNVQVIGFWNRAIYTPAGISRRLFQLPQNIPVQVFIPLDFPAPYQVQHEGLTVIVGGDRLIVQPDRANFEGIAAAMEIGRRALRRPTTHSFHRRGLQPSLQVRRDGAFVGRDRLQRLGQPSL